MDRTLQQAVAAAEAVAAENTARMRAHFRHVLPGVLARLRAGTVTKADAARELGIDPVELVGLMGKHGM